MTHSVAHRGATYGVPFHEDDPREARTRDGDLNAAPLLVQQGLTESLAGPFEPVARWVAK